MEIYTVSFFGHRDFSEHFKYEDKIKQLILKLLRENEYVEFLVGRNGEFDLFVSSVIRMVKKEYGYDNCSLTLVLPYMTAEFKNNEKYFLDYYDNVEICTKSQIAHFKSAITVRNKCIIDRCNLTVFYVKRNSGGAYEAMKYAKKTVGNMPKHTLNDFLEITGISKKCTLILLKIDSEEYVKLMDEVNDTRLLSIANERMQNFNSANLISSEDLYKELGITKDDLDAIGEVEFE